MATSRRRVVWSLGARDDLDQAIEYIAQESPDAALGVLDRLLAAAGSLENLGERGRMLRELSNPEIRELLLDPFRLVCRVTDSTCEILGILHQRRDFKLWDRPPGPS